MGIRYPTTGVQGADAIISKKAPNNPTADDVPQNDNTCWVNTETGEIFAFKGLDKGGAVWVGQLGTIVAPTTITEFDIFNDGSAIALYRFEDNANDDGGQYNGTWDGAAQYDVGKLGRAAKFDGSSQINCGVINADLDELWISFWMNWDGTDFLMPTGFNRYDLLIRDGYFGFNTSNNDIYGIDFPSSTYANKWVHVACNFKTGDYGDKLYINGAKQTLGQKAGSITGSNATIKNVDFHASGWGGTTGYRFSGMMDQLRIFNRPLTDSEVQTLYSEGQ